MFSITTKNLYIYNIWIFHLFIQYNLNSQVTIKNFLGDMWVLQQTILTCAKWFFHVFSFLVMLLFYLHLIWSWVTLHTRKCTIHLFQTKAVSICCCFLWGSNYFCYALLQTGLIALVSLCVCVCVCVKRECEVAIESSRYMEWLRD